MESIEKEAVLRTMSETDGKNREYEQQKEELFAAYHRYVQAHDEFKQKMEQADWDQYEKMAVESEFGDNITEEMHQELVLLTSKIEELNDKLTNLTRRLFGKDTEDPNLITYHPHDQIN